MTAYALVGAADFNDRDFARRAAAGAFDRVVAVDGGYGHLVRAGFAPDEVIGDFDSLGFVPDHPRVVRFDPHKDASDIELALMRAVDEGATEVVVYGCLSGRLDHTVGVLQLLAKVAERGVAATGIGDAFAVRALAGPASFDIPQSSQARATASDAPASDAPAPGVSPCAAQGLSGTVSVFSACDEARGVTERGLAYPLENATLANRTSLGLSNELVGQPATISVEEGTLYVFYPLS